MKNNKVLIYTFMMIKHIRQKILTWNPWLIVVIILSIFLRFYNYYNHWGLAVDQAHDVLVARYILTSGKIPLLGPFSSAGPFQMSGFWYWFIALSTAVYTRMVITPWVMLTIIYVLLTYIMYLIGKEMINDKFGIIVALFTSVSTAQIAQAVNLTNQSPLAVTSACAILYAIRYMHNKKFPYAFLLGFFVSLGASIHLQGAANIFLIICVLFLSWRPKIKELLGLGFGLILPFIPVVAYDMSHHFENIGGMLQYYFVDKYQIPLEALGRRWLTYIGVFWPTEWARIIGGNMFIGGVSAVLLFVFSTINLLKRKLPKEILLLVITLSFAVILIKDTRTPLFSSYLVFLHPYILILTAWVCFELMNKNRLLGIIVILLLTAVTLKQTVDENINSSNRTSVAGKEIRNYLLIRYPGKKFSLYDNQYKTALYSLSLSLYLDADRSIDDHGIILAFNNENTAPEDWELLLTKKDLFSVYLVPEPYRQKLVMPEWNNVNPSGIYHEAVEWKN